MDTTRIRKATHGAVAGPKGTLAKKAEGPIAARTPFSAATIRSVFGAIFLFLAGRTIVRSVRAALR